MAVAIESVPMWPLDAGIGHVLPTEDPGSVLRHLTPCGTAGNTGRASPVRPRRACGRCRRLLAEPAIHLPEGRRHAAE